MDMEVLKKLSGNRRRPFVFVITQDGKQKAMGYFCSQVEAEIYAAITIKRTIKFCMDMKHLFRIIL